MPPKRSTRKISSSSTSSSERRRRRGGGSAVKAVRRDKTSSKVKGKGKVKASELAELSWDKRPLLQFPEPPTTNLSMPKRVTAEELAVWTKIRDEAAEEGYRINADREALESIYNEKNRAKIDARLTFLFQEVKTWPPESSQRNMIEKEIRWISIRLGPTSNLVDLKKELDELIANYKAAVGIQNEARDTLIRLTR